MIILLQWTLANPTDWVEIDVRPGAQARLWRNLPKKPVPTGNEVIDNTPGWLFSACVQGVDFYGFDHVAADLLQDGALRVFGWNDDLQDHPFRWGEVWEFRDGWVDRSLTMPDGSVARHQGPDQRKTVFSEDVAGLDPLPLECGGLPVEVRPWSEFPVPQSQITIHGIWVNDPTLWQHHYNVRRRVGWPDWVSR